MSPLRRLVEGRGGRALVLAIPLCWLLLFFFSPFLIVLKISLAETLLGRPPYSELLQWVDATYLEIRLNLGNYLLLLEDSLYVSAYLGSLRIAAVATLLCLLIGYPMAYGIARSSPRWRTALLMLVILPFWTSFLIRVYAWIGLLKTNGLINNVLMAAGVIDSPLPLLHSEFAVLLGIVYSYLPFMILPLYASLARMDLTLLEAAEDLGARPWRSFLSVTLPLSLGGVVAGSLLVFIPAVGEFVIPDLLGGPDTLMIGKVLWTEFFGNGDWPLASAVAVALLLFLVVPVVLLQRFQERAGEERP